MHQTASQATLPPAGTSTDGLAGLSAAQMVQLGRALHEIGRILAEGRQEQPGDDGWRSRLKDFFIGLAGAVGEAMAVAGGLQLQRPENWPTGSLYVLILPVIQDGFPVLWVPEAEVLQALSKAPDRPRRQQLLLDRRDEILANARRVLTAVTSPDLSLDREVVGQALACVVDQPYPAQIASLNVATQRALAEVGESSVTALGKLAKATAKRGVGAGALDVRKVLMLSAIAPALEQFYPDRQDPIPERPNRHAVDHVTSPLQYTPGNALESVLLAVSVLRQAQANRGVAAN